MRKGFTLIELLVVIAIIAVLAVVVVLTLNPAELLRQSRDSNRLGDMSSLNTAINLYNTDQSGTSGFSLGSSSVVYVSIPDPNATTTTGSNCSSLGLPALPSTYVYHCAASSTYRKMDGTGWMPVNLSSISAGSPFSNLPVDPTNQSSSRLYYTYTTNSSQFEITAAMESQKYKLGGTSDQISGDGGTLASVFEKGSRLGFEPLDYGDPSLVGLWTMDEGMGSTSGVSPTADMSGNNNIGTWYGTAVGTNGTYYTPGKVGPWAGYFNGSNDGITVSPFSSVGFTKFSVSLWVNGPSSTPANPFLISDYGGSDAMSPFQMLQGGGNLVYRIGDGTVSHPYSEPAPVFNSSWNLVTLTYNGSQVVSYVNGVVGVNTALAITPYQGSETLYIGDRNNNSNWPGLIDDVRVYNRALSAAEVQEMYNVEK
jgi:prepilin-type N-terminal cleavage/methylation domain-containing protein